MLVGLTITRGQTIPHATLSGGQELQEPLSDDDLAAFVDFSTGTKYNDGKWTFEGSGGGVYIRSSAVRARAKRAQRRCCRVYPFLAGRAQQCSLYLSPPLTLLLGLLRSSQVRLDRCRITENTATQSLYADRAEAFGKVNDFIKGGLTPEEFMDWAENTGTRIQPAGVGGGGILIVDSHVNMTRCEVRGNIVWAMYGTASGGGIHILRSAVNIVASVFTENEVSVYNFVLTYDIVQRSQGDLVTSVLALDFPGVVETLWRNIYQLITQISESTGAAISVGSERDFFVDVVGSSKDQLFLKVRKRSDP
jgi:hypothetical protein